MSHPNEVLLWIDLGSVNQNKPLSVLTANMADFFSGGTCESTLDRYNSRSIFFLLVFFPMVWFTWFFFYALPVPHSIILLFAFFFWFVRRELLLSRILSIEGYPFTLFCFHTFPVDSSIPEYSRPGSIAQEPLLSLPSSETICPKGVIWGA